MDTDYHRWEAGILTAKNAESAEKKKMRSNVWGLRYGATVLIGKLEFIIFEEAVHQDDEFTHAGGQGDQWFFAVGA